MGGLSIISGVFVRMASRRQMCATFLFYVRIETPGISAMATFKCFLFSSDDARVTSLVFSGKARNSPDS